MARPLKISTEPLKLFDIEAKQHVTDLLTCHGPLSFRKLRLFMIESFPVGALMPMLVEMMDEEAIKINKDGYWCASEVLSASESTSFSEAGREPV